MKGGSPPARMAIAHTGLAARVAILLLVCGVQAKSCTKNTLGCKPSCSPGKDALGNAVALQQRLCKLCKCRECSHCAGAAGTAPHSDYGMTVLQHPSSAPNVRRASKKTTRKLVRQTKPEIGDAAATDQPKRKRGPKSVKSTSGKASQPRREANGRRKRKQHKELPDAGNAEANGRRKRKEHKELPDAGSAEANGRRKRKEHTSKELPDAGNASVADVDDSTPTASATAALARSSPPHLGTPESQAMADTIGHLLLLISLAGCGLASASALHRVCVGGFGGYAVVEENPTDSPLPSPAGSGPDMPAVFAAGSVRP